MSTQPLRRNVIELKPFDGPRIRPLRRADVVPIREDEVPAPRWKRILRMLTAAACLITVLVLFVVRDAKNHARIKRFSGRPTLPASHPFETELLVQPGRR